MTFVLAHLPDDPVALPGWLEEQLVGDQLGELVAELSGTDLVAPAGAKVDDSLGADLPAVLEHGLKSLPPSTIRALIKQPGLLLELQELVFLQGGHYWRDLPRPASLIQHSEAVWSRLRIDKEQPHHAVNLPDRPAKRTWARWSLPIGIAASVLAVVLISRQMSQPQPHPPDMPNLASWGWQRGMPAEREARPYLEQLAAQVEEWSEERPISRETLVARLRQFRQGCDVDMASKHPALNEGQRRSLIERCGKWSGTIDTLIARAANEEDIEPIQQDADDLVAKLAAALRGRIASIQS